LHETTEDRHRPWQDSLSSVGLNLRGEVAARKKFHASNCCTSPRTFGTQWHTVDESLYCCRQIDPYWRRKVAPCEFSTPVSRRRCDGRSQDRAANGTTAGRCGESHSSNYDPLRLLLPLRACARFSSTILRRALRILAKSFAFHASRSASVLKPAERNSEVSLVS
jgi:hypothetical protein